MFVTTSTRALLAGSKNQTHGGRNWYILIHQMTPHDTSLAKPPHAHTLFANPSLPTVPCSGHTRPPSNSESEEE